jgi:hypothetical protein
VKWVAKNHPETAAVVMSGVPTFGFSHVPADRWPFKKATT